jgi:hypothetical protein
VDRTFHQVETIAEHADRDPSVLSPRPMPSDITGREMAQISDRPPERRRISKQVLANRIIAVNASIATGNMRHTASCLEDLASACLAWSAYIKKHRHL